MKLPKITVKRPVTTIMAFMAVLIFGVISMRFLPSDVLPDLELPTVSVITVYPGASAGEVEKQVTDVLEESLSGTESMKEITSNSRENVSFITLQFNWGADITEATNNVRDMMELAKQDLPDDANTPRIYKINSSMIPVVIYGITADEHKSTLNKLIDDRIAPELRKAEGVGTVMLLSQQEREIKVQLDPRKIKAYNLNAGEISTILKAENITIPGGNIEAGKRDFAVRIPGELSNIGQLRNIALTNFNGQLVRLKDVAEIKDGYKDKNEVARADGRQSVTCFVQKQSGANTLDVYRNAGDKVKQLHRELPEDVEIVEVFNTAEIVTQSISNLTSTILFAGLFVMIVVFLFLREWRSSLIVILTIPVSLIVAFIFMFISDYTINIFSLMSLIIAIGMVVDNAIVVLENITRHIEEGERPDQASIFGTGEMGMAITASTFTTISVFLPMMFIGGIVGILFKQLAILTSITLIASLIASVSLTPMLTSRLLKNPKQRPGKRTKLFEWSEKIFEKITAIYYNSLQWALNHRVIVIALAVVIVGISIYGGRNTGSDYIPEFDAGDIMAVIETEVETNVDETRRVAIKVEKIFNREVPEMTSKLTVAGQTEDGTLSSVGFDEGKNIATIIAHLELPGNRERSAKEIAEVIRRKVEKIPEVESFRITGGSVLSSAILGNNKPIEIEVSGNDFEKLNRTAATIRQQLEPEGYLTNLETTIDKGKLELQVQIDKDRASALGLNTSMIGSQVRNAIYGTKAGSINKPSGKEYQIMVRYAPEQRQNIDKLDDLMLTTLTGEHVPLKAVAEIEKGSGPLQINHQSQQRIVRVTMDLARGASLGDAAEQVEDILKDIRMPQGITVEMSGQVSEQQESFSSLYLVFIVGIVLVYMVMASQFESFKDPFVIIFAIPFSVTGIIWAFMITGLTLSVVTFIGAIMLLGIVVNNGIVLVDYTNLLRKRGNNLKEAVLEGGRSRLRPVLMTTLTTVLGMLPMALSTGMGSEMWRPLGITIIGGLLISALITLILIPVIYTSIHYKAIQKEEAS
ncbi:MAG: efflux RND transporter permease subunit [Bacteroidales bacterium]|nr:efflux RND transporter permease subunit [Bacteroidales bacterium]